MCTYIILYIYLFFILFFFVYLSPSTVLGFFSSSCEVIGFYNDFYILLHFFFFSFGVSKGFEGLNLMIIISHHVHIWLYILKTSVASPCQM